MYFKQNPDGSSQTKVTSFFASDKVVFSHTKETFKTAIVCLAVNNAVTFRFFTTKDFLALIGELADKLKERILHRSLIAL
jgi:hypothetical protein